MMKFESFKQFAEKSLVSDFTLPTKIICVCLLIPPIAIELYNLFFRENKLVFPFLEVGIVIWAIICVVYLLLLMPSEPLQKFSIKEGIEFFSIRRKITMIIAIFVVVSLVFSLLSFMKFKQNSSWREGVQEVEKLMKQVDQ